MVDSERGQEGMSMHLPERRTISVLEDHLQGLLQQRGLLKVRLDPLHLHVFPNVFLSRLAMANSGRCLLGHGRVGLPELLLFGE